MNREKIKSTLLNALREAGSVLKSSLSKRQIIEKKSELSLVTVTDKEAEKIVLEMIRREFPDHAILSEESPASGNSTSRWIIDPLDGTTNFAHTYPVASVSIAFEEKGEVLLGGVLDPFRDELFFAERGKGATLNNRPMRVSESPTLSDSLVATGFPYDRRKDPDQYLRVVKAFMMKVQGIRRTGSAALDLCFIACGRFDGFWELKLQPWDMAAASLMVEEAGGSLSDFSGGSLSIGGIQTLATNGFIHKEMLDVLKPFENMCKE